MSRRFDVFIASPNDVQEERRHTRDAIGALSDKLQSLYDVTLSSVHWKQFAPVASKSANEPFQAQILTRLDPCRIFIGILYRRYGTAIPQMGGVSGTEREFRFALEHRRRMKILTYFREQGDEVATDPDTVEQLHKVNLFKKKIEKKGLPYAAYKQPEDFQKLILLDLMEVVVSMLTDAPRRQAMRKFFCFDRDHGKGEPSVLIGYPAIHKHLGDSARPDYDWQKRLLPNVIYEDFKTIQKLESALVTIGVRNYSSVTTDHPMLTTASPGNRIWLCVPRNTPAQRRLKSFGDRVRFRFEGDDSQSRTIVWKRTDGSKVEIRSPLATYLTQRPAGTGQWRPEFGHVHGRDFAVIARFRSSEGETEYFDYFVAGIRGLGTWGGGWYIDRCPELVAKLVDTQCAADDETGDVQAVLQVEFADYRIQSVRDVSDEDQGYFDRELEAAGSHVASNPVKPGV